MSYRQPQFTIQQEFAAIPSAIVEPLQTCIVGPNKRVFEYTNSADKETISYGAYTPGSDTTFSYAGLPAGAVVETDSVELYLEEAWALMCTVLLGDTPHAQITSTGSNQLTLTGSGAFATTSSGSRSAVFKNRDIQAGDRVKVSGVGALIAAPLETSVVSVSRAVIAASAGAATQGSLNLANQSLSATVTKTATGGGGGAHTSLAAHASNAYVGDMNLGQNAATGSGMSDTYTITCTTAGATTTSRWTVTSLNGDNATEVVGPPSIGTGAWVIGTKGLVIQIGVGGAFVTGDVFQVVAVAKYTQVVPTITVSAFSGTVSAVYTLTVVSGGTWDTDNIQVSLSTNNGVDYDSSQTVLEATSKTLGNLGLLFTFPAHGINQDGLVTGETYSFSVTAASQGAANIITLANTIDPSVIINTAVTVDFYIYKSSINIPIAGYPDEGLINLEAGADEFIVQSGIAISDSTWYDVGGPINMLVKKANLFVPYSSILTIGANDFGTISDLSSVESVLGKIIPSNPLAYGVYKALENSNGQPVNYVSVETDDLSGYTSALVALEQHEAAYFIVPLTSDSSIQNLYKAHVLAMSDVTHQFERILFVSVPLSDTVVKYGQKANGSYWLGSVASGVNLTITGATFLTDGIRAGDSVRTEFGVDDLGNVTYISGTVASVADQEHLTLVAPGFIPDYTLQRTDIVRNLTKTEKAEAVAANSSNFSDRRVYSVWPDLPIDDAGNTVPGHFLAASIAGLKSSVAPHQGITNYSLTGWSDMSRSFKHFTPTQLNTAAASGTLIVTQDAVGGEVYVRHQLSSDQTDANTGQLSITTNLDSITKFMRGDLKNFIGKYNSGPNFERIAHAMILQKVAYLQTQTITATAGAQITDFDPATLIVAQDPLIRTTVTASMSIGLPYPVDNFDLTITVV